MSHSRKTDRSLCVYQTADCFLGGFSAFNLVNEGLYVNAVCIDYANRLARGSSVGRNNKVATAFLDPTVVTNLQGQNRNSGCLVGLNNDMQETI